MAVALKNQELILGIGKPIPENQEDVLLDQMTEYFKADNYDSALSLLTLYVTWKTDKVTLNNFYYVLGQLVDYVAYLAEIGGVIINRLSLSDSRELTQSDLKRIQYLEEIPTIAAELSEIHSLYSEMDLCQEVKGKGSKLLHELKQYEGLVTKLKRARSALGSAGVDEIELQSRIDVIWQYFADSDLSMESLMPRNPSDFEGDPIRWYPLLLSRKLLQVTSNDLREELKLESSSSQFKAKNLVLSIDFKTEYKLDAFMPKDEDGNPF